MNNLQSSADIHLNTHWWTYQVIKPLVCGLFGPHPYAIFCARTHTCTCTFFRLHLAHAQTLKNNSRTFLKSFWHLFAQKSPHRHVWVRVSLISLLPTFLDMSLFWIKKQKCAIIWNTVYRSAVCQFPFWWIYCCHSSKSTKKETDKTHLCAVCWLNINIVCINSWAILIRIIRKWT